MKTKEKILYFEGAGWSGANISKATIGKCDFAVLVLTEDGVGQSNGLLIWM